MKFFALPTWIIVRLAPLRPRYTLDEWNSVQNDFLRHMDLNLWFAALLIVYGFVLIAFVK